MKKTLLALLLIPIVIGVACGGQQEQAESAGNAPQVKGEETAPAVEPTGNVSVVALIGNKVRVGAKLPKYVATGLDGSQTDLSAPSDRVRLVNIWATWCTPCRFEIPALIALQNELGDRGLEIVGVSIDARQAATSIEGFVEARGINYTITHDPDSVITEILDTYEIPTTILIDREGTIVWYHKGVVRENNPELREALDKTL